MAYHYDADYLNQYLETVKRCLTTLCQLGYVSHTRFRASVGMDLLDLGGAPVMPIKTEPS